MIRSTLFICLIILSCFAASAFLISDQGNNVRLSNGTMLEYGNLTISIHDSASGGNTIFSSTIEGAIVNGSWNLMINPDIQYGQIYWKDYEINGEDLDFDGNDRLQFQSSSGLINNASFLNFSMIGSCSSGSAIKFVYANGSVECESVISGGVDLSDYALKNQSETFAGNISTTETGFFGWIGSLTNRITGLFVRDVDASGNVNAAGNISATYILGDGSFLTNLPAAGAESDPIFVAENSTLWSAINSKLASSDQRYNESSLIIAVNRTTNIMSLGFYNTTQVNSLISSSGNLSFNQTLTNSLYYSISNPSNFVNNSQISNYNETTLILTTNSSLWSYIASNQDGWSSTFNTTYNRLLGAQCPSGYLVNGTLQNGTLSCLQGTQTESDPLWSANSSLVLYLSNLPLANRTISHINNITGFFFNYNQTGPANSYTNAVNSSIVSWVDLIFARVANVFNRTEIQNQYYNKTEILSFGFVNSSGLGIYNETLLINAVNQTLSSLKLNASDQRYNETALIVGINSTGNIQALGFYNISQVNTLISGISGGNSSFNQSLTNSLYYSISNPSSFINSTTASIYNDSVIVLSVNSTIWSYINSNQASWTSTFNSTYNSLLGQQCASGQVVDGTLSNGTISCVDDQTSGASSTSGTNFMNILAGAVTDTNAPATERIVGNSQYLVCTNATGYDTFRYGFARSATNGATNAHVYIKYIAAPTSTITGSSYTNLSTSVAQTLSYTLANTATLSDFYTMDSNLGDICLAAFQAGGDGVLDPQWRNIWIELS